MDIKPKALIQLTRLFLGQTLSAVYQSVCDLFRATKHDHGTRGYEIPKRFFNIRPKWERRAPGYCQACGDGEKLETIELSILEDLDLITPFQ